MQVVIKGKNMEVNDRLREFVEGKISKLSRVLPSIAEAEVEFSTEKTKSANSRFIAQVTLKTNGQIIRAENSAADTYSALDVVLDKLDRQITRYKTRRTFNKGGGEGRIAAAKGMVETEPAVDEDEERMSTRGGWCASSASPSNRWTLRRRWSRWSSWATPSMFSTTARPMALAWSTSATTATSAFWNPRRCEVAFSRSYML